MLLRLSMFAAAAQASLSASEVIFRPERVPYSQLDSAWSPSDRTLVDSLSKDGIVSVTGIPGFGELKRSVLKHLHTCLSEQEEGKTSLHDFAETVLADGTVRRTMASTTIPGPGGARPFFDRDVPLSAECARVAENLESFRKTVDEATDAFSDRLGLELGASLRTPLMSTQDGSFSFDGLKDVVRNGEHLEHFHSYRKSTPSSQTSEDSEETIALHTDQGLFIALTPGLMVDQETADTKESDGFYVLNSDGDRALVEFGPEDDLVFMMGDGVNQYVNPMLKNDHEDNEENPSRRFVGLRATPHAVSLSPMGNASSAARVWYGLMVLPPSTAFNEREGRTYGEIRRSMGNADDGDVSSSLGCSSSHLTRVLSADDEKSGCAEGSAQCWFRCMELVDHDVSHETCGQVSDDHAVKCVNPRGQVSNGWQHGDYFLTCTDSVKEVTPYPKLPNYRDEIETDDCSADKWKEFWSKDNDVYDHSFNLTYDNTTTPTLLHWSVTNKEAGIVKGRLSFNGIFGWLAVGFLNLDPDAHHNGMNGANIILGTPGSDYSAVTGLDTSKDTAVAEYKINPYGSSFRHWQDAVGSSDASIVEDGCFTALEFETSAINGERFDVAGSNAMLWGGNNNDAFVGYHSHGNRGIFTVEWATGKANFGKELLEGEEDNEEKGDESEEDSSKDDAGKQDEGKEDDGKEPSTSSGSYQLNCHNLSTIVPTVAGIVVTLIATL